MVTQPVLTADGVLRTHAKLLLDEPPLQLLPTLAVALGLTEAILLQQLHYWLKDAPHVINSRPWIYNSYPEWCRQFPFWSERTIQRAMLDLERRGLVVAGSFNGKRYDRTKWYTIDYDRVYELVWQVPATVGRHDPQDYNDATTKSVVTITTKWHHRSRQNGTIDHDKMSSPIPETTTEITAVDLDGPNPYGDHRQLLEKNGEIFSQNDSLNDFWAHVLDLLRSEISPANFRMWIERSELVEVRDHTYVLRAVNRFSSAWLRANLTPLLRKTIARVAQRDDVQVQVVWPQETAIPQLLPGFGEGDR